MRWIWMSFLVAGLFTGCGGSAKNTAESDRDERLELSNRHTAASKVDTQSIRDHQGPATISTSAGTPDSVVVLWPRVIPRKYDPKLDHVVKAIQTRLHSVVSRALPGKPVDRRPSPQRVCPQRGCDGVTAGVLVAHADGGCAVLVFTAEPGSTGPRTLIPWAGGVTLKGNQFDFRSPPESLVQVQDFAKCESLLTDDNAFDDDTIIRALQAVGSK